MKICAQQKSASQINDEILSLFSGRAFITVALAMQASGTNIYKKKEMQMMNAPIQKSIKMI